MRLPPVLKPRRAAAAIADGAETTRAQASAVTARRDTRRRIEGAAEVQRRDRTLALVICEHVTNTAGAVSVEEIAKHVDGLPIAGTPNDVARVAAALRDAGILRQVSPAKTWSGWGYAMARRT